MAEQIADALQPNGDDSIRAFEEARANFVHCVNGWLKTIAECREGGFALEDGREITEEPLVRLVMEPTLSIEYESGVSLRGDGVTTPLILESVTENDGTIEVIRVIGSDPIAKIVYPGYDIERQAETIAAVSQRTEWTDGTISSGETIVRGDGSVKRHFIDHTDWNVTRPVLASADMELLAETSVAIMRDVA
jgi:hypothetical protein